MIVLVGCYLSHETGKEIVQTGSSIFCPVFEGKVYISCVI